ncbi:MAG TPA: penicillin-binding protein 1A [bacterium]|nr:penicillin-binding protein 1A [bacterium]
MQPRPAFHLSSELRRRLIRHGPKIVLAVAALVTLCLAVIGFAFAQHMAEVDQIYAPPDEATRIYAANGEIVASLFRENREYVPLQQIPLSMRRAVLASEDTRFYQHVGIDLRAIGRAILSNLRAGRLSEGGSTITQQLARNRFLTPDRTFGRKLAEIVLAVEIERRLSKDEILERYLNEVYFGQGAYGIEMAARVYFGKGARDLTLDESALLTGLIRAPSLYSPYRNPDAAKAQQRIVLKRMANLGYITTADAHAAMAAPIALAHERNAGLTAVRAPYFVTYLLPYLIERYGADVLYRGGLRIYTTLDLRMQIAAERAVRDGLDAARARGLRVWQGALVAIDPRTGSIRAMIGGYDYERSQFNRAWQARRQAGSAFKPFVYTAAVEQGWRPSKILYDTPLRYGGVGGEPWVPRNYDRRYRGAVTLRYALEHSINVPAIKTIAEIGPERVVDVARRMGIASPLRPDLTLALGSSEVTPLEMASAFGTLAAVGVRAEPIALVRVIDRTGKVLEESRPIRHPALEPDVALQMTDLLKGVILRGTGRGAAIGRPAAGKTGTSDDYRNAWFIGYTPQLSAAVWVGNDDNSPMRTVVGGTLPAGIWASFMRVALEDQPPDDWEVPEGVVIERYRPVRRVTVAPVSFASEPTTSHRDDDDKDRGKNRPDRGKGRKGPKGD